MFFVNRAVPVSPTVSVIWRLNQERVCHVKPKHVQSRNGFTPAGQNVRKHAELANRFATDDANLNRAWQVINVINEIQRNSLNHASVNHVPSGRTVTGHHVHAVAAVEK